MRHNIGKTGQTAARTRGFSDEPQFVRWLQAHAPQGGSGLKLGIGDDAALVITAPRHDVVLTTDLSVESVHFSPKLHPPEAVGHRALARALSDIAAMGGQPKFALVSLALSRTLAGPWVKHFYQGLFRSARRLGVSVIGGDTTIHAGPTVVDVIVAGEVKRGRAMLRSRARIGDVIFVGGRLGCSALGLSILESGPTPSLRKAAEAPIRAHLFPEPQCRLGEFLSRKQIATAAIDLSDGLSTDLGRLCKASGVGADIHARLLPLPAEAETFGLTAPKMENLALYGGEDYKLLFTVSPQRARSLRRRLAGAEIFKIGAVTKTPGLWLVRGHGHRERLRGAGYDHFRRLAHDVDEP